MALRETMKSLVFLAGGYAGRLRSSPPPGVAVLCYHGIGVLRDGDVPFRPLHVEERRFDAHCRLLAAACVPVSLAQVQAAVDGRAALPRGAVLMTFDDGCRSVLTRALPILERHRIPAVVFACSGTIERQELPWYDALARRSGETAVAAAKALSYDQWKAAIDDVVEKASATNPHAPLTIPELQQLAAHPLITIGAHTVNHPILAAAPPDVQRAEIEGSRASLAAWTGQQITAFAYPNGRPRIDYTTESVGLVRDAGFQLAFTTRAAYAHPADDVFEQPRFVMLDMPAAELAHRLAFSWPRSA